MNILVLDMGGSAVKYGVWDGQQLGQKGQFPTPTTWKKMQQNLVTVLNNCEGKISGVAVSAPGVVDQKQQRIFGNSAIPYIHGFNIFEELEALFKLPVTIENDANCAGMAEFYEGAAKGYRNAAFVVIGTGIGGAIFVDGHITKGAHLYGGEFGLMYLDNGQTFSKLGTAVQMAWRYCDRRQIPRDSKSGAEVFQLAQQGDEIAKEEVEKFYEYLTQGIWNIQFVFDPEIIVLGGGVSGLPGLVDELNQRISEKSAAQGLFDFVPQLAIADYQNDANLIGAAADFIARQQGEA